MNCGWHCRSRPPRRQRTPLRLPTSVMASCAPTDSTRGLRSLLMDCMTQVARTTVFTCVTRDLASRAAGRRWLVPAVLCRRAAATADLGSSRSPASARWAGHEWTVRSIGAEHLSRTCLLRCRDLASPAATPRWRSGWARTSRSWSSDTWRADTRRADTRRAGNGDVKIEVHIDDIRDIDGQPGIDVHDRRWRVFAYNGSEVPVHARRARWRWWLRAADRW